MPESERIRVTCPGIADESTFTAAAATRASRRPRATPPRVALGAVLDPDNLARLPAGLPKRDGEADQRRRRSAAARTSRTETAIGSLI